MGALRLTPGSAALLALALCGCGGDDLTLPGGETSRVQMIQGNEQVGPTGSPLQDPLIVRLLDEAGTPIPNRTVLWVIKAGGGGISPTTGMTDAEGFASAAWTLGPAPGANLVNAEVPNVGTVTFTATATADTGGGGGGQTPSPDRSTLGAEPTSIAAGTDVSTITVTVLDAAGSPVPGATVELQATGTGNALTQPAGPTGADGVATGTLQSTDPGDKTVSAVVNGSTVLAQTVVVTVSETAPSVDHLIFLDEPPATVTVKQTFTVRVALVDAAGDVVPLSGIFIYLGLFHEDDDHPNNDQLGGERFANTQGGIAVLNLSVEKKGRWRIRALTDDLPQFGQGGPKPYLFSHFFEVQ